MIKKYIPESVNERLNYDPVTGVFTWIKENKRHPRLTGKNAGFIRNGYLVIKIDASAYRAHRIAWFMHYGVQPEIIDHINGNGIDNRIENLRNVTFLENAQNHGKIVNGSGLPCGVRPTTSGKFQARIRFKNNPIYLGTFDSPESAHQCYMDNRKKLFGEYCRGQNDRNF